MSVWAFAAERARQADDRVPRDFDAHILSARQLWCRDRGRTGLQQSHRYSQRVYGELERYGGRCHHGVEGPARLYACTRARGRDDPRGVRLCRYAVRATHHGWTDRARCWGGPSRTIPLFAGLHRPCRRRDRALRLRPASDTSRCRRLLPRKHWTGGRTKRAVLPLGCAASARRTTCLASRFGSATLFPRA